MTIVARPRALACRASAYAQASCQTWVCPRPTRKPRIELEKSNILFQDLRLDFRKEGTLDRTEPVLRNPKVPCDITHRQATSFARFRAACPDRVKAKVVPKIATR